MARSAFVTPEVVRLSLADSAAKATATFQTQRLIKDSDQAKLSEKDFDTALATLRDREALADGHFIDVKKRLNVRETRRVFSKQVQTSALGDKPLLDLEQVGFSKVLEYLCGWSGPAFIDEDGHPVPYSPGMVDLLLPEMFQLISEAIDQHEAALAEERDPVKNRIGGVAS